MIKKFLISLILFLPLFFGCSQKFDTGVLGETQGPGNSGGDTVFVHVNPDWGGFNNPQAILIGHEPFIYVCDTDNNKIVMLNTAGGLLGTLDLNLLGITKPIAIAQDYRLNLIVCAQTKINSITYSAAFKIDLYALKHLIANANFNDGSIKLILPRAVDIDLHPNVTYSAVTAFYDNSYDIARIGTQNSSIYDPDNAILRFQYVNPDSDAFLATVHDIDPLSSGLITANGINCMTSFNKKNIDFIATYNKNVDNATAFKAQWFQHYETQISEGYRSAFSPSSGMAFVKPGRFGSPTGSCIDPSGNIYISDGDPGKDSVFKFSPYGEELQSFGGPTVFSKPAGVAFFDRTLYVLDSKLNVIRRFILSTDIGQ
jgi:hypothetical protein